MYNGRLVPSEQTTPVAFRLPIRLVKRIDRHAKRLSKKERGVVEFSRTDALRDLLTRALEIAEKEGEG